MSFKGEPKKTKTKWGDSWQGSGAVICEAVEIPGYLHVCGDDPGGGCSWQCGSEDRGLLDLDLK